MDEIGNETIRSLVPALEQDDMLLNKMKYEKEYNKMVDISKKNNIDYPNVYCLAEISNFNKLIALSNQKSLPVFELRLNRAHEGQLGTLKWFKFLYTALADRIIGLTNE